MRDLCSTDFAYTDNLCPACIGASGRALPGSQILSRATCEATYTVVAGDTCDEIATKNDVTVSALEAANPVSQLQFHSSKSYSTHALAS